MMKFPRSHSLRTPFQPHPYSASFIPFNCFFSASPAVGLALGSWDTELNKTQPLSQKSSQLRVDRVWQTIIRNQMLTLIEGGAQTRHSRQGAAVLPWTVLGGFHEAASLELDLVSLSQETAYPAARRL